jgi:hypothetical protein
LLNLQNIEITLQTSEQQKKSSNLKLNLSKLASANRTYRLYWQRIDGARCSTFTEMVLQHFFGFTREKKRRKNLKKQRRKPSFENGEFLYLPCAIRWTNSGSGAFCSMGCSLGTTAALESRFVFFGVGVTVASRSDCNSGNCPLLSCEGVATQM